jgi:hypothetical protein
MWVDLHAQSQLFVAFNGNRHMPTMLAKPPNMKFHENPSGGSCAVTIERTDEREEVSIRYCLCERA